MYHIISEFVSEKISTPLQIAVFIYLLKHVQNNIFPIRLGNCSKNILNKDFHAFSFIIH